MEALPALRALCDRYVTLKHVRVQASLQISLQDCFDCCTSALGRAFGHDSWPNVPMRGTAVFHKWLYPSIQSMAEPPPPDLEAISVFFHSQAWIVSDNQLYAGNTAPGLAEADCPRSYEV